MSKSKLISSANRGFGPDARRYTRAVSGAAALLALTTACGSGQALSPIVHLTKVEGVVVKKDSKEMTLSSCAPSGGPLSIANLETVHLSAVAAERLANQSKCTTTLPIESASNNSSGPPSELAKEAAIGAIITRVETVNQARMTAGYEWKNVGAVLPG